MLSKTQKLQPILLSPFGENVKSKSIYRLFYSGNHKATAPYYPVSYRNIILKKMTEHSIFLTKNLSWPNGLKPRRISQY